jgi:hypothetical protein
MEATFCRRYDIQHPNYMGILMLQSIKRLLEAYVMGWFMLLGRRLARQM